MRRKPRMRRIRLIRGHPFDVFQESPTLVSAANSALPGLGGGKISAADKTQMNADEVPWGQ